MLGPGILGDRVVDFIIWKVEPADVIQIISNVVHVQGEELLSRFEVAQLQNAINARLDSQVLEGGVFDWR